MLMHLPDNRITIESQYNHFLINAYILIFKSCSNTIQNYSGYGAILVVDANFLKDGEVDGKKERRRGR